MLARLHKIFVLFLMMVFLHPSLTDLLHYANHCEEVLCTDYSQTHLHSAEHHCPICDYSPTPVLCECNNLKLSVNFLIACIQTFDNAVSAPHEPSCYFSLRGPPVV